MSGPVASPTSARVGPGQHGKVIDKLL